MKAKDKKTSKTKKRVMKLRGVAEVARRCGRSPTHVHFVARGERISPRVLAVWNEYQAELAAQEKEAK